MLYVGIDISKDKSDICINQLKKIIRAFHLTSELIGTFKLFKIGVRELAEM